MAEIIPAIMPKSYEDLREKLSLVSTSFPWAQIDVMDGQFVDSKSWPYNIHRDKSFEQILSEEEGLPFWDRLNFEIDLMVSDPDEEVKKWMGAGAQRLVLHLESFNTDPTSLIEEIKKNEVEVGLALDMKTPIEKVLPFLGGVDFVQLMGIDEIGYQGQPFNEEVIQKVKELKEKAPSTIISVDGGVNSVRAPALTEAGADRLIVGSAISEFLV